MFDLGDKVKGMWNTRIGSVIFAGGFSLLMSACGSDFTPVSTVTPSPANTPPSAAATVRPTEKPASTATRYPTKTPTPYATQQPADVEEPYEQPTPENSPTAEASPTPTPPEPTVEAIATTVPLTATSVPPSPTSTIVPPTATPEPTFRDYALERLQEYHGKNPLEVYSSESYSPDSLDRMLNFIEANESLVSDYDGRDFHILTTFLTDNPNAVKHATAVDQYVREIDDMIFDYCGLEQDSDTLNTKIEGYGDMRYEEGEEPTVRDMINLNWSNFLPFVDDMDPGQRLLPREIFITDLTYTKTGRRYSDEIDPDRYNERIDTHRPNLVEVARHNITHFQEIRENALRVVESPDYLEEVSDGAYTNASILVSMLGGNLWPNSAEQAEHDTTALLNEGSEKARTALQIYAYDMDIGWKGRFPETRVELAIGDLWALPESGIKAYRISASGHGELAFGITDEDLKLMQGISDEKFLVLPSPYGGMSANIQWTRTERAKLDGIQAIDYVADDGHWEVLLELK
tara:strand:+ start:944 stop:2497 length:1554 start_codon:yes stop_codon:yes gene_type:complete